MYQPYILKYDDDSLEPEISKKTVEIHYHRHYLNYLKNLNEILRKNNYFFQYPKEELFENIDIFPEADRNTILFHLGGVVNHELYFSSMNKNKNLKIPEPLHSHLIEKFGNIENFMNQFLERASSLQGSGYTFLAVKPNQELFLLNLPNQESPYLYQMQPILAIDVWEHAYYLDYYNNRKKYIEEFLKLINFTEVNRKYQEILKKEK